MVFNTCITQTPNNQVKKVSAYRRAFPSRNKLQVARKT